MDWPSPTPEPEAGLTPAGPGGVSGTRRVPPWREGGRRLEPPSQVSLQLLACILIAPTLPRYGFQEVGQTQNGQRDVSEATCHLLLTPDTSDSVQANEISAATADDAGPATPDAESYLFCASDVCDPLPTTVRYNPRSVTQR